MPVAERCLPFKVPIVEMERLAKLTHGPNGLLILDTLLTLSCLETVIWPCACAERAEGIYNSNLGQLKGQI